LTPSLARIIACTLSLLLLASRANAQLANYYIAVDSHGLLTGGAYAGLPSPNFARLTFLYAHVHQPVSQSGFHAVGAYSYTGDVASPQVVPTSTDNTLPEDSGAIELVHGQGLYANRLRTVAFNDAVEYAGLEVRTIESLRGFSLVSLATTLLGSSSHRWSTSLAGTVLAWELVEKSPGLHVGTEQTPDALVNPGDRILLGDAPLSSLSFTPVLWVPADTPASQFTATFKLVDMRPGPGAYADSGTFSFILSVPEPSSLTLLAATLALFPRPRRRAIAL
jgi:hypothetical protein